MDTTGRFIISLDFELYWGVRDKRTLESYRENLLGVYKVIPELLKLFNKYDIHATWATVGFLFFESLEQLKKSLPENIPEYKIENLSPYKYINKIEDIDDDNQKFHFALPLIQLIKENKNQEIASHTFSHYYCLEDGQTMESFKEDIELSIKYARKHNIEIKSLVFPRNQYNEEYISACKNLKIKSIRGNTGKWPYVAVNEISTSIIQRGMRLIDTYFNILGHNCYDMESVASTFPYNIKASRFFRPETNKNRFINSLVIKRVMKDMTYAAKNNFIYHLWWHPHNFGKNTVDNIRSLEKVLNHYKDLKCKYCFQSANMNDIVESIEEINGNR
jgi:peptidoglycan/xylan/chitin deacetylase (PgdA/CDA1 family)